MLTKKQLEDAAMDKASEALAEIDKVIGGKEDV